eukprot:TRINITY_DN899_c0_g2_i1.p1 TRINITY_DN899_c0_g2~~TRINITY_DN899_c0_g2_i1.p1  ORF type:complete len:112 (+),score=28.77 TRINITY_DN899_c0_g2_i1:78-413(+)
MKSFAAVAAACFAVASAVELRGQRGLEPAGSGTVETTMDAACEECKTKAPYLKECVCHASDIAGTFENDATKEITTRSGYGTVTENTGANRLPEQWVWHCRPVTEGPWKQC